MKYNGVVSTTGGAHGVKFGLDEGTGLAKEGFIAGSSGIGWWFGSGHFGGVLDG